MAGKSSVRSPSPFEPAKKAPQKLVTAYLNGLKHRREIGRVDYL